jgi:hypothetical protein
MDSKTVFVPAASREPTPTLTLERMLIRKSFHVSLISTYLLSDEDGNLMVVVVFGYCAKHVELVWTVAVCATNDLTTGDMWIVDSCCYLFVFFLHTSFLVIRIQDHFACAARV